MGKLLLNVILLFFINCFSISEGNTINNYKTKIDNTSNVYIDSAVKNIQSLELNRYAQLNSVYQLFSHGKPGKLYINNKWLGKEGIVGFLKEKFSLNSDRISHLNIYGCEFAKGAFGKDAVAYIEKELNISVAASTDITGKDGNWNLEVGKSIAAINIPSYIGNLQYLPGDDADGDGISNLDDLDDDNDGVPDTTECTDYVSIDTALLGLINDIIFTNGVAQTYTDVSGIVGFDVRVEASGNFFSAPTFTTDGQFLNFIPTFSGASNSYKISFIGSVLPGSLVVNSESNLFARNVSGGNSINEQVNIEVLSSGTVFSEGERFNNVCGVSNFRLPNFTKVSENNHSYIMPRPGNGAFNSCGFRSEFEASAGITSVQIDYSLPFGAASDPSTVNPFYLAVKMCYSDTDGDGIENKFDNDSDNDGCSDALEAKATTVTDADYQFPDIDSNNDGLVDAVDVNGDGRVDYVSSYNQYALDSNAGFCIDSDNDGVLDNDDIDDDNDGVLDIQESCSDGLSSGTPFTSISQASNITAAGIYFFNIGGYPFSTYVNSNGYVKVAIDYGFGVGDMPQGNVINNLERGILSPEILASLTGIEEVRINDSDGFLDAVTTESEIADRLVTNQTLHIGQATNAINSSWTGTNAQVLTANASCNTNTNQRELQQTVIHTCGNTNGMVWKPVTNDQKVQNSSQEIKYYSYISLWVKGGAEAFVAGNGLCDIDNDGLPSHLDPDADGDGCSDALEAGATTSNAPEYIFTNITDVNGNGLEDSLEDGVSGNLNYQSTFSQFGLNPNLGVCLDSDGDGLTDFVDIDDDNDGVPDRDENCSNGITKDTPFTSIAQARNVKGAGIYYFELQGEAFSTYVDENGYVEVAIDFGNGEGTLPASSSLGTTTRGILSPTTLAVINGIAEVRISDNMGVVDVVSTNEAHANRINSNFTLNRGSADNTVNNSWTGVGQASFNANGTCNGNTNVLSERIYHTCGNGNGFNWLPSTSQQGYTFNSGEVAANVSFHLWVRGNEIPEATDICDYDNDGIENFLDLDSDGDGCSDSFEAGAIASEIVNNQFVFTAGGAQDTNNNGLADIVEALDGVVNYQSTYDTYAANGSKSLCLDSDGDGILDLNDIDDDNDGILDIDEQEDCIGIFSNIISGEASPGNYNTTTSVTGQLAFSGIGYQAIESSNNIRIRSFTSDGSSCYFSDEDIYYYAKNATDAFELEVSSSPSGSIMTISFDAVVSDIVLNINSLDKRYLEVSGVGLAGISLLEGNNQIQIVGNLISDINSGTTQTVDCNDNDLSASGSILLEGSYQQISLNFTNNNDTTTDGLALHLSELCAADLDTDGDGTPNRLDLDSDGDGCSDSFEGGAIDSEETDHQFTGADTNGDGLVDEVDIDGNGVPDYEGNYSIYALNDQLDLCVDTDGDGISDSRDIDDDNDGVPDVDESSGFCQYYFNEDLSTYTFTGSVQINTTTTENSITFNRNVNNNVWRSTYSDQSVSLPMYLEYKVAAQNVTSMLGVIPENGVKDGAGLGGESYKFYFRSGTQFDIRANGTISSVFNYSSNDIFAISIDESGNLNMYQNGELRYSQTVPVDDYQLALSTNDPTSRTYTDVLFGNSNEITQVCNDIDTDGDGIPNRLDLDSDGDMCSDAYESGATTDLSEDFQFPNNNVGVNGLDDSVESSADSGEINYSSTYKNFVLYSSIAACLDTDSDGITDVNDLDDDNDGILDVDECEPVTILKSQQDVVATTSPNGFIVNDFSGYGFDMVVTSSGTDNILGADDNQFLIGSGIEGNSTSEISSSLPNSNERTIITVNFYETGTTIPFNVSSYSFNIYDLDVTERIGAFSTPPAEIIEPPVDNNYTIDFDNEKGIYIYTGNANDQDSNGPNSFSRFTFQFYNITSLEFIAEKVDASNLGLGMQEIIILSDTSMCDTDEDGIFNQFDLDSDGDGCSDAFEGDASFTASDLVASTMSGGNTNGEPTFNGYGAPNVDNLGVDVDADPNSASYGVPLIAGTGQGVGDSQTLDSDDDNDGIGNSCDCYDNTLLDTDGDGVPDYADVDSDNDGIYDSVEGDGTVDTDGDGVPNYLDLDSDNDGIPDAVEASGNISLSSNPDFVDCKFTPGNVLDPNGCNTGESSVGSIVPINTDALHPDNPDAIPDYLDLDSDGDTCPDGIEAGFTDDEINTSDYTTIDATAVDTNGLVTAVGCFTPSLGNWLDDAINDACCEIDEATLVATAVSPTSCDPGNDGMITISGGGLLALTDYTVSYTYEGVAITPFTATTQSNGTIIISGLEVGSYTDITITSTAYPSICEGVVPNTPIIITPFVSDLTVDVTQITSPSCAGGNNGAINITVSGGSLDYSYAWSPTGTNGVVADTQDQSALEAGSYDVTVTDNITMCFITITDIIVNDPSPLVINTPTVVDVTCSGGSNGSITVSATGGSGVYQFSIDGFTTTVPNGVFTGLSAGNYTIEARDANDTSCEAITPVNVAVSEPLAISGTTVQTDVYCFGEATGAVVLTPAGGTPPYSYLWSTSDGTIPSGTNTNKDLTGLTGGTYSVVITDVNGCTIPSPKFILIGEPTATLSGTATQTNNTCNGAALGEIDLTTAGGTPPYTYQWTATNGGTVPVGSETSQDLTGLTAGTYSVVIEDLNGCETSSINVVITEPTAIVIGATPTVVNVTCNGGDNGRITATATGGSGTYEYSIDGFTTTVSNGVFTGLTAGNYTIEVRDANFTTCEAPSSIVATVSQPDALVIGATPTVVDVTCNGGSNGSITATATGGSGTYEYSIDGFTTTVTDGNFTGLSAGSYTIEARDANDTSCEAATPITVTVNQPDVLVIGATPTIVDVSCNGGDDGSVTATATGGSGTYEYSIDGFTTTVANGVFTGLSAGDYTIEVRDANDTSCEAETTVDVTVSEPLVVSGTTVQTDVSCFGDATGAIALTPAGGTPPYSYVWSTSDGTIPSGTNTNEDLTGLTGGTYSVVITDSNGCTNPVAINVLIGEPTAVVSGTATQTNVSCNGGNTGSIDLTPTGGVTPYTYAWTTTDGTIPSSLETAQDLTNLPAGTYSVVITDFNGCSTASIDVTITEPAEVVSGSITKTDILCNGDNTGSIDLTPTGGTAPYTYVWSTVGGAVPSGQENNQDLTDLVNGIYRVIITDANGCTNPTAINVQITEPAEALTVSVTKTDVLCTNEATGGIDITASGGTSSYTYLWTAIDGGVIPTGTSTNEDISGLVAGSYNLVVTDANGCTNASPINVVITEPAAIVSGTTTQTNILCTGNDSGAIDLTATGGTAPYTYLWTTTDGSIPTGVEVTEDPTNLTAGTYSVVITDANGCTNANTIEVTITEPAAAVSGTTTAVNILCNGDATGTINLTVSGGTPSYTYLWTATNGGIIPTGQENNEDLSGLTAGTYSVVITDTNGCTNENPITVTLTETAVVSISEKISDHQNVTCVSPSIGAFTVVAQGGSNSGFIYTIAETSETNTTGEFTGLAAGNYTVTVEDDQGCELPTPLSITIVNYCIEATKTQAVADTNGDGSTNAGDVVTYTIAVTNNGQETLTNVSVSDIFEDALGATLTLTSGPTYVSGSASLGSTEGTLLVGESATYTAIYTLKQSDVDAGGLVNSAIAVGTGVDVPQLQDVSDDGDDTDGNNVDDSTDLLIIENPIIELIKTASVSDVDNSNTNNAGDIIMYTFTIENIGNVTVSSLTITDNLTDAEGGVLTLTSPISFVSATGNGTATSLAPGERATYTATYNITQADVDAGGVSNTATADGVTKQGTDVSDISDDGVTGNGDDNPTETLITKDPVLALIKTASTVVDVDGSGDDNAGDRIRYTFRIENNGNVTIDNLILTDNYLPASTDLTLTDTSIAPGEVINFTADYFIVQNPDVNTGEVINSATITGDDPDGDSVTDVSDNGDANVDDDDDGDFENDSTVVDLTTLAELDLQKLGVLNDENGDGITQAGETITYSFTVTNTGNISIENIVIDDPILSFTGTTLNPATLAIGQSGVINDVSYTILQQDIDNGSFSNTSTATGQRSDDNNDVSDVSDDGNPTNGGNNNTVTNFTQVPEISLLKEGVYVDDNGDSVVNVGDIITYTFTVENTGNVTVSATTIEDSRIGASAENIYTDITEATAITDLSPGELGYSVVTYSITQSDIDAGNVTNTAIATGADPEGDPVTATSDNGAGTGATITDLPKDASLELIKEAVIADTNGNGNNDAGDIITYTFTVTNTGNVTVTGLIISDPRLPVSNLGVVPSTLAPNAIGAITSNYTITQADVNAGSITNTATVTGKDPDDMDVTDVSDSGNGTGDDPTVTPITGEPSIQVTKTQVVADTNSDGLTGGINDLVTYTITVTNTGNVSLENVSITDTFTDVAGNSLNLDSGPTFVASSSDNNEGVLEPAEVATYTATYTIKQKAVNGGGLNNEVLASGDDPNGTEVTDQLDAPTILNITEDPSIEVIKGATIDDADNDNMVSAGDVIIYTISVENTGNVTVNSITLTDTLTDNNGDALSLNSGPTFIGADSGSAQGTLLPSEIATYTANYILTQSDINAEGVTNSVLAEGTTSVGTSVDDISDDGNTGDGDTGDDPTVTDIPKDAALTLIKKVTDITDVDSSGDNNVGDIILYSFTIENTGNVTIDNIVLTDDFLPASTDLTVSPTTLQPGGVAIVNASYTLTQSDIDAGEVINSATTSGTDPDVASVTDVSDDGNPADSDLDPDTDGDNDPTYVSLMTEASLELIKSAVFNDENGNNLADVNETITYSFDVKNTGNITIETITIDDAPLGLTDMVVTPSTLGPNQSGTAANVEYTITQDDINSGSVSNTAIVTGNRVDDASEVTDISGDNKPTSGPDEPTVTTFDQNGEITLLKEATYEDTNGDGIENAGDRIVYDLTVTNIGNVTITGINLVDARIGIGTTGVSLLPSTLNPGAVGSRTVSYTITQADVDAGRITNTATATGQDPNGDDVTAVSNNSNGTGPTVVEITKDAEIQLIKTSVVVDKNGSGVDDVGDVIEYTFTVTNVGNVTITIISISDATLGITNLGLSPSTLAPGEIGVATAEYTIKQSDIDAGQVVNTATATGEDPDGGDVNDDSDDDPDDPGEKPTVTTLAPAPDILVIKIQNVVDTNSDGVIGGVDDVITYSIRVINTGNVSLTGLNLVDTLTDINGGALSLDSGPTFVSSTLNSTLGNLKPNEQANYTATYTITQSNVDEGGVSNSVSATATSPIGVDVSDVSDDGININGDDNPTVWIIDENESIEVIKTADLVDTDNSNTDNAGDTVNYEITVTNTGNVTVSGLSITDTLTDADGNSLTLTTTPTFDDATLGSDEGTLLPNETATYTASYILTQSDVNAGGVINSADANGTTAQGTAVSDTSDDDNPVNGTNNPTTTNITKSAALTLVKTADPNEVIGLPADGSYQAGDNINYTFSIRNTGNVTINGLTLVDNGLGTNVGDLVVTPTTLAPNEVANVTYTYVLVQDDINLGEVENTATVTGNDPDGTQVSDISDNGDANTDSNFDGDPGNDPTITLIPSEAELELIKTATINDGGDSRVDAGDTITYTFSLTNTGFVTVDVLQISDPDIGIVDFDVTPTSLDPGENITFTDASFVYTITQADIDSGSFINQATVTGEDPAGDPVTDRSDDGDSLDGTDNPTETTLTKEAELTFLKTASAIVDVDSSGDDSAGDTIEYIFTVTNTGNVTIDNIVLTDDFLPSSTDLTLSATELAPGAIATVSATYVFTQADINAGSVINEAEVAGTDPQNASVGATSEVTTPLLKAPSLELIKTSAAITDVNGNGLDDAGDTIAYTFTVTNTGNVTVRSLTITDTKLQESNLGLT
uniref:DUF7507 domain-containing protein n=1 Tax=Joostella sp. TaxID=2231138 RepID=UPI003A93DC9D